MDNTTIIYTPHECTMPSRECTKVGTIARCDICRRVWIHKQWFSPFGPTQWVEQKSDQGDEADPPEFRVEPLADGSFEFHVHTVSVWITKRGALELIELLYRDVVLHREGERS